jgi:membrane fusion protein, multidrug efflux system
LSQQDETVPAPANGQTASPPASPGAWRRLVIPVFAVLAAFGFIILATVRWDAWVGSAAVQSTNDAYIRADLTQLSSRVAGEVIKVAVVDFQRVKAGDLLVQIDPADYEAQVAQAEASVAAAQAALDNLNSQVELQYATIAQAEAQQASALAQEVEAHQEQQRQQSLTQTEAGTRQKLEQAIAGYASAQANVRASRALIAAQRHQLDVLSGTKKQRAADLLGAKAALAAARLKLGYTRIVAPFDGVVGARQVQPNDYVNIGSNLINVVPLPNVYVIANYKETQLTRVKPGQPVDVTVDTFPSETLRARVARVAPASGSQFALLPPDNATGNFTKVVQRVPVRIEFEKGQPLLDRLLPGMSVVSRIRTNEAAADGGK